LLPMLWGGVEYHRFEATSDWQIQATVAECPALAVRAGAALFAFNPLKVIHRYLNMADPKTTRDLTDLLVKAVLGASGIDQELDDDDLRRDFHALGVSSLLLGQMHKAAGQSWDAEKMRRICERLPSPMCRETAIGRGKFSAACFCALRIRASGWCRFRSISW